VTCPPFCSRVLNENPSPTRRTVTKSRCNEAQIVGGPRDQKAGSWAAEVCRQRGIIEQTFYLYGRLSHCKSILKRSA
jgi:putative transposase